MADGTHAADTRGDATTMPPSITATPSLPPSVYLLSGGVAGLSVDLVLFPLDTIKTRMQSRGGLTQSGGFRKLFSGIASAAAGSAPTAALFFLTYEGCKRHLTPIFHMPTPTSSSPTASGSPVNPIVHCLSASCAEVVACLIRVPTENVKQKVQAGLYRSSWECFRALITAPAMAHPAASIAPPGGPIVPTAPNNSNNHPFGIAHNFYRGFGSTILREIPFAFIQFPLYEWGKHRMQQWRGGDELDGLTCACIGSTAGGIAAAATTPLDVVKTRLMLHRSVGSGAQPGVVATFRSVYNEGGIPRLFSGLAPRVLWISLGGGVFFGAYEITKRKIGDILADK